MKKGIVKNAMPEQKPAPQDKAMFMELTNNGMKVIHSPETSKMILSLVGRGTPAEGLAMATESVIKLLDGQSGGLFEQASDAVKQAVATELMTQISEVADAAGIFKPTDDIAKEAAGILVGRYMKEGVDSGRIKPEDLQQIAASQGARP